MCYPRIVQVYSTSGLSHCKQLWHVTPFALSFSYTYASINLSCTGEAGSFGASERGLWAISIRLFVQSCESAGASADHTHLGWRGRNPAAINTGLTEVLKTKERNHPRPCLPVRIWPRKAQERLWARPSQSGWRLSYLRELGVQLRSRDALKLIQSGSHSTREYFPLSISHVYL